MLIGEDYPKIEFEMFGFELLEPMALVTDSLLAFLAFYFAYRINRFPVKHPFNRYWTLFFLIMGISTFLGGLAHGFYNYWGTYGKIPSWFFAPMAMYFMEQGFTHIHDKPKTAGLIKTISKVKYVLAFGAWLSLLFILDLDDPANEKKPFLPLALNAGVGSVYMGIILSYFLMKRLDGNFKYFVIGTLITFPALFILLIRIHPHQWFNGEDLGHVMMMITYFIFFYGLRKLNQTLLKS